MSFGRRLALFFILIALVPTVALVGMLLIVSEDSRVGKADARLAAGLETALALYEGEVARARSVAQRLAADPGLGQALTEADEPDAARLQAFAERAAARQGVSGVEVLDADGMPLAFAGSRRAIGFADVELTSGGQVRGALRVSTESATRYAADVRRLTKRELVLQREGEVLVATVTPPGDPPVAAETVDLELSEGDFRAHLLSLDAADGETLLLLGPAKEGGLFAFGGPAVALLVGFLLLGVILAYGLARTLTGLHTQVAEQAVTDPLTGLWNRRRMLALLEQELERAGRFGHEVSVLILDIDNFKAINDEMGHLQGDEVLERIAEIVRDTTRSIDLGARYGGDELALVLLETDADGALVLGERLRSKVHDAEIPLRDGGQMGVTVSIGIATASDPEVSVESLIEAADQALLVAKRAGKDQVHVADG